MNVICVNNGYLNLARSTRVSLTIGKSYSVIEIILGDFKIENDLGDKCVYHNNRFKYLEDVRNDLIDSIIYER